MTALRIQLIRARLAELMHAADPRLTPEDQLLADVRLFINPKPTEAEFNQTITVMEKAGQITRLRTEHEGVKTKLTDEGRAELIP